MSERPPGAPSLGDVTAPRSLALDFRMTLRAFSKGENVLVGDAGGKAGGGHRKRRDEAELPGTAQGLPISASVASSQIPAFRFSGKTI